MADEIRINRPVTSQPQMHNSGGDMHHDMRGGNGGSKMPWIVLGLIVVIIIILAVVFKDKLFSTSGDSMKSGASNTAASMKSSGYESVFLTNGQVYFGKISNKNDQFVTLEDIYYLQVNQPALQGSSQNSQQAQQQPQLSLVKLGNELHGPVDKMSINRDQILFFEDMKEDGKVMQAIREYQKNPPAANAQQTPAQQAPVTTPTTTPTK